MGLTRMMTHIKGEMNKMFGKVYFIITKVPYQLLYYEKKGFKFKISCTLIKGFTDISFTFIK